jgi:DNA sulfur modification protein DndE
LSFNRIRVGAEATNKLKVLKARTGLTPNVLCRLALTLSLSESGLPNTASYDDQGQEFNRYTLTGEWDQLFLALLKERLVQDDLDIALDLLPQFKAHLNRGVALLYGRVKSLSDLQGLLRPEEARPAITTSLVS